MTRRSSTGYAVNKIKLKKRTFYLLINKYTFTGNFLLITVDYYHLPNYDLFSRYSVYIRLGVWDSKESHVNLFFFFVAVLE